MGGWAGWRRWGGWALAVAVALWILSAPGERGALTDDERDYAQAAIHLLRHGVFSHAPDSESPAPDAYREPGYAAFVAAVWRLCGADPPARPEDLVRGGAAARRAVACLGSAQRLLLAAAAWAAARAARRLGGGRAAAAAAGLRTLTSPALLRLSGQLASEALAAALLTSAALVLAALAAAPSARRAAAAGLLLGALVLTRAAFAYLVPLAALVPLLGGAAGGRPGRRRLAGLAALLAGLALLAPAAWAARNAHRFGHWALAESRVVPLARAELGIDVAREGPWAAALAWTPGGLAGDLHRRWFPESRLDRWRWSGPPEQTNYFVRAVRRHRELLGDGGDRLAADAALRREALAAIRERPGAYLLALPPLLWRGLFAERSPGWARPFDLALPLGLLLATGCAVALGRALADRHGPRLALLSLPALSYLFHALATEQLPRFHQPALPLAWAAAAVLLIPRGAAPGDRLKGRAARVPGPAGEEGRPVREKCEGPVEMVVLLDEAGHAIGTAPKSEVHHAGTPLHLAFSLFLFDREGRTLLQRRSFAKRTWPGVWSNSCCGHPGPGEELAAAARRRLADELGLAAEEVEVVLPDFRYRAEQDGMVENEICPVLAGRARGEPRPDPSEVAEIAWHPWEEVLSVARESPERLSPWASEEARLLAGAPRFASWWERAISGSGGPRRA